MKKTKTNITQVTNVKVGEEKKNKALVISHNGILTKREYLFNPNA